MSGIIAKNASRSSGIIGPVAGSGGTTNRTVDTMTGDASDTTLALSQSPGSENNVSITFDGVMQHHDTYSLSGSTITFSTAPPTGVLVEAVSGSASTTGTPDDGTVSLAKIANNAVDETKLKDAFVGDFSDVTVTAADAFLYGDATDSGNTKKDTVQGILDLAGGITEGTAVTASSGTTVSFTSLPAGLKRVTLSGFDTSSSTGAASYVRASTGGAFDATNYLGVTFMIAATTPNTTASTVGAFAMRDPASASEIVNFHAIFTKVEDATDVWEISVITSMHTPSLRVCVTASKVDLGGELDGVQFFLSGGTIDAGTFNVAYE